MARADIDRREFAKQQAAAFSEVTLRRIGRVLDQHSAAVVAFACEMQERLEAAEALLAEVASCSRADPNRKAPDTTPCKTKWSTVNVRTATMDKIDALVASAKARPQ